MRILPVGDRGVLVELETLEQVHQLHRAVLAAGFATESVPGLRTLLVTGDQGTTELARAVQALDVAMEEPGGPTVHVVPVAYDGQDLGTVAQACGLTVAEVVRLHHEAEYVVAMLGFSRGFPYLAGLPAALHLPRLATPRTRVPERSVALAGDLCGIYPTASPGGWHLIGTTPRVLFDPAQDPPTPLRPGDVVRFVPA